MIAIRYCLILSTGLISGVLPSSLRAQSPAPAETNELISLTVSRNCLPVAVSAEDFDALRKHSPFVRTLNMSKSLIITGLARIEEETVATVLDLETRQSYALSQGKPNSEGWSLVEIKGNPADMETLTAKVKVAGDAEVVSIRYEKAPPPAKKRDAVIVSNKVGNGTAGGGTNPHGGPDPRVLTPDQMSDARNAARNIQGGFKADGYGDNEQVPPDVVSKISRLSVEQRESINVKMYEYRNKGLGMKERKEIYNNMLDKELKR